MELEQQVHLHHSLDGMGTINTLFLREHKYKAPVKITKIVSPNQAIVTLPDGYELKISQRDVE